MSAARLALAVVAVSLGVLASSQVRAGARGGDVAAKRSFHVTYEAEVKSAPAGSKQVELWIPVPQDSGFQKITHLEIDAPSGQKVEREAVWGNKMLHVTVDASRLPLSVKLACDVERAERKTSLDAASAAAPLAADERTRLVAGSKLVPVGDGVDKLAQFQPKSKQPLELAREAYDHVLGKMKYDKPMPNPGWGNGSTEWACSAGYGNCTDFHSYFMSLVRTAGIPARFHMGLPLPTDKKEGDIAGYHCWAEFYVDGKGWIPVDISEAWKAKDKHPELVEFYFGGLTPDRVEFSSGRDLVLAPPQKGAPLNYFIYPYCEIDGKAAPGDAVTRKFTFKDL